MAATSAAMTQNETPGWRLKLAPMGLRRPRHGTHDRCAHSQISGQATTADGSFINVLQQFGLDSLF
jgi:hypothetical protein